MEFYLHRLRDHGRVVPVNRHHSQRGRVFVRDVHDEALRRPVKVAEFKPSDGYADVPPLRDVVLVAQSPAWMVLNGVEEIADEKLLAPRSYAQSWRLTPAALDDLILAESNVSRLAARLAQCGVRLEVAPNRRLIIPGESE